MRDQYFDFFISNVGEATSRIEVPEASIQKWRGKLPDQLLTYWREEGWCGYADGLFWTVNPDEYQDLVDFWLRGTFFPDLDSYHAIARTAFGEIYLFGEETGTSVNLSCFGNYAISLKNERKKKSPVDLAWNVKSFFSSKDLESCDIHDEDDEPLFQRALQKLGPLDSREVYGFEPALVAGGAWRLENLAKLDLQIHLTILRQLAPLDLSNCGFDASRHMN